MLLIGIFCFFMSIGILLYYRFTSRQNFFFRRAPQLKISELHTFDDTWITGLIDAPNVVVPPVFLYKTVHYDYALYEKMIRYVKDSDGKERKVEYWQLIHSQTDSSPFFIDDGSGKILINPAQAIRKFLMSETYETYWWKHVLTFFPASGLVSSVGIVSENKSQMIAKGETPLMVTPLGRKQFMQAIKSQERFAKYGGLTLMWISFTLAFMEGLENLEIVQDSGTTIFIIGGLLGLIPFAGIYYYFIYNSFVDLRRKVINSWANIDVELKARRDLIPNFVASLEGYMSHEKNTLTAISILRTSLSTEKRLSKRIKLENEISHHIAKINLLVESNPELKQGPVYFVSAQFKVIEDKIANSRSHFNSVVEEYNSLCGGFPSKFIAGKYKFEAVPFYGENKNDSMTAESLGRRQLIKDDGDALRSLPSNIAAAVAAKQDEPGKKAA